MGRLQKREAIQCFVCDTPEMARAALAAECAGEVVVGLHVLHELPDPLRGDLTGIAVSPSLGRALYFPFAGPGPNLGRPKVWLDRAAGR